MTDDHPFRLKVLYALTTAFKEITPANGFTFDMADFDPGDDIVMQRVFRGRPWFGDSDPIPMLSVLEAVDGFDSILEQEPSDLGTGAFDWQLIVQGFVNDDPMHPTDPAYRLLRDVRRCLGREKKRVQPGQVPRPDPLGSRAWTHPGCRVEGLRYGLGNVRPADDTSSKAYFVLPLTLRLIESDEGA